MRHLWLRLLAPSFSAVVSCSEPANPSASAAPAPRRPAAAQVELGAATAGNLVDSWRSLGDVRPALSADLAAAVPGHVKAVNSREGDRVAAGELLVLLDRAKINADLAAARAKERGLATELEVAKKQLDRVSKLSYPTISDAERERFEIAMATRQAELETQQAETRRIAVEWSQHAIRSPFAGVIKARTVHPGDWVNAGQTVLSLVSLQDVEVHVDVSGELGTRLRPGERADLISPADGSRAPAVIAGLVPALDPQTRTMRARLIPSSRPSWLLAGMSVDVEFSVVFTGGVTVPLDSLVRGPVDTRVVKVVAGKAAPIPVDVIATARGLALVRGDGLAAGDRVVIRGNERIRPGQPLEVLQ